MVPAIASSPSVSGELEMLRGAIKEQQKVNFEYRREDDQKSVRIVHPLGLFYWGKVWTLVAWCELRDSFRHFRLDRMSNIAGLGERYESVVGRTLQDFLRNVNNE